MVKNKELKKKNLDLEVQVNMLKDEVRVLKEDNHNLRRVLGDGVF